MEKKQFPGDFSLESRVVQFAAILQSLALIAALLLFFLGRKPTRGALLAVAGCALLAFVLLAIFLFFRYRLHPSVREKKNLLSEFQLVLAPLQQARNQVDRAPQTHKSIDAHMEKDLAARQRAYQRQVAEFQSRRQAIAHDEKAEAATTLQRMQGQYVAEGLKSSLIRPAKISGVGPKLKDRLSSRGITTAAHVTRERVAQVDGFGEAKVKAILAWRSSVESHLNATKPADLPEETRAVIKHKHDQLRAKVAAEEKAALAALEADLANIRQQAAVRHRENHALEAKAQSQIEELEPKESAMAARLDIYSEISLPSFLRQALWAGSARWPVPQRLAVILVPLLLAASLVFQGGAAMGTFTAMVIESIPTRTPTPTTTNTPTITPTFTSTPTATPTDTPTVTFTPSPTPIPTATSTPLPTDIPTPIPTPTQSPTATPVPAATPTPVPSPTSNRSEAVIADVVDGDTVDVTIGGQSRRVQYIGITAPDVGAASGEECKSENQALVEGKTVYLETDEVATDQAGNMLAYIFLPDGTFVNAEMVRIGCAKVKENPANTRYYSLLAEAQQDASASRLGVWSPSTAPTPKPTAAPPPPTSPPAQTNCSPCYIGVCIKPPPPDLNCKDIPYRRFTVGSCDPHGFDGDGDGVGCES